MRDRMSAPDDTMHRSPPLALVAVVFVVLCLASLVTNLMFAAGAPIPSAYPPIDALQNYYTAAPGAVRLSAFFQFGASIPFAILVASMVSRLLFHRVTVAGAHIALVGGTIAALYMGLTALATWALTHPGFDPAVLRVTHQFAIACDAGHAAGLGLFVAGISVPSLAFGLLPRWLSLFGLVLALVAELSVLTLILSAAAILLPLVHIASWIWLIAAAMMMPAVRVT
jgi:hypothetical protein